VIYCLLCTFPEWMSVDWAKIRHLKVFFLSVAALFLSHQQFCIVFVDLLKALG